MPHYGPKAAQVDYFAVAREVLARCRRVGRPWQQAWPRAVNACDDWTAWALAETEWAWHAAFNREPPPPGAAAGEWSPLAPTPDDNLEPGGIPFKYRQAVTA